MNKLRFWGKVIGRSVGLGAIIMWLLIFIKAHVDNHYTVLMYVNNFHEAWLETILLLCGLLFLIYDIYSMKKLS